uniref:Inositol oxygenase n=1 Tax=Nelumbo nucifera TaxID=4432 RepID=A0A822ZZF7_NELNU|nr:TPA_asm: hypothetical protein HUJ06_018838 [Nelumbo nucifera]
MREEYGKLNRVEMSIWECCELLNEFVDESDPDLDEPQIEHLLQTAEAIRKDYPNEDWLHLTGLIHGIRPNSNFLAKLLLHNGACSTGPIKFPEELKSVPHNNIGRYSQYTAGMCCGMLWETIL